MWAKVFELVCVLCLLRFVYNERILDMAAILGGGESHNIETGTKSE